MSAERQVFKALDQLSAFHDAYHNHFTAQAEYLLKQAVREFFLEHIEIDVVRINYPTTDSPLFVFSSNQHWLSAADLAGKDPQLSKCLTALGDHITAFNGRRASPFGYGSRDLLRSDFI